MSKATVLTCESGSVFLRFDAGRILDASEELLYDDLATGNGVWSTEEGKAVFYPACEHPNVVRGYN